MYETIPLKLGLTAVYITHEQADEHDDEEVW